MGKFEDVAKVKVTNRAVINTDFVELKDVNVGSVFVRRSEVACFNRHANSGACLVHLKSGIAYTLVKDVTMKQLTDPESELCLIQ